MNIETLVAGIHHSGAVSGLTHDIYRYPARFSPVFARAAIESFSKPGDVVLDPFVGGSTTLVEAIALGRSAVGIDVSQLAVFLARAKTMVLTPSEHESIQAWVNNLVPRLSPQGGVRRHKEWDEAGYQVNLPWRVRKLAEQALNSAEKLPEREEIVARCIVLKSMQWAVDCKEKSPTAAAFRAHMREDARSVLTGLASLAEELARYGECPPQVEVHNASAESASRLPSALLSKTRAKLIVTSPPYPGVHVLYHRWQVRGRRETAAPFWIANCLDGQGASFYTFSARGTTRHEELYFDKLSRIFEDLRRVVADDAYVVQLVGFANPIEQLPQYLSAMNAAGFREAVQNSDQAERFWRRVPNRKWYASLAGDGNRQTHEILLIHRPD